MSSSTPLYQPPPPPPSPPDTTSTQQAYASSAAHGSVGPVIGVLAVVTVMGVAAGMIGRMCSGKPVMGYGGHLDLEAWMEAKCASCIDGSVPPPPRPSRAMPRMSEEAPGEVKEGGRVDRRDHDDDEEGDGTDEEHQEDGEGEEAEEEEEEEKVSHERN